MPTLRSTLRVEVSGFKFQVSGSTLHQLHLYREYLVNHIVDHISRADVFKQLET
jgi:hypothetical protein